MDMIKYSLCGSDMGSSAYRACGKLLAYDATKRFYGITFFGLNWICLRNPPGPRLSNESIVNFRFEFAKIFKFYTFGKIQNVLFRVIFNSFTSRHTVRSVRRFISFHARFHSMYLAMAPPTNHRPFFCKRLRQIPL